MNLKRNAREYYTLGIVTDPEVTSWDATFNGGTSWVTGTPGTHTVNGVVVNVHRWLIAGPTAPVDGTPVAATITTDVNPDIRATDNPEILVRDAKRIYLRA